VSLQKAKDVIASSAKTAQVNIVDADTAEEGRTYKGEILDVTQHHIVQLRNSDIAYIHESAKLSEIPEKGKPLTIEYRNGWGKIQVDDEEKHTQERETQLTR
jgi:hypothetical protein